MSRDVHINQNLPILLTHLTQLILIHHGPKLRRERLSHLHRLADARALDNHILNLVLAGEPGQLGEEVAAQGTTDAAVLELNEFFFGLGDMVVGLGD